MISTDVLLETTPVIIFSNIPATVVLIYGHISCIEKVMMCTVDSCIIPTNILLLKQLIMGTTCSVRKFVLVKGGNICQIDLPPFLLLYSFDAKSYVPQSRSAIRPAVPISQVNGFSVLLHTFKD